MWLERRYPPGRFHRCAKRCNAGYVSLALLKTTYLNSISLMCFPGGYPALGDGVSARFARAQSSATPAPLSGSQPAPGRPACSGLDPIRVRSTRPRRGCNPRKKSAGFRWLCFQDDRGLTARNEITLAAACSDQGEVTRLIGSEASAPR